MNRNGGAPGPPPRGPVGGAFVISKKTWDKLTPEVRAVLTRLGEEFSERGWEIGRKTTQEGIDENKKKGMEVIPMSPAMAAASKKATTDVIIPSWLKRSGPDGKAVFNQYLAPHAGYTLP